VQRNKVVSKRKGALAVGVGVGVGVVSVAFASPVAAVVGLAAAGYLTWDWVTFRIKNGMRF
jgi:hypothetical protein